MAQRIIQFILVLGAVLFGTALFFYFSQHSLYAQMQYFGPTSPVPGLVKVEIQIYDDPDLGGVTMQEVIFNEQSIPLKPVGIHGYRGGGSFQEKPGTYKLVWKVARTKNDWPRTVRHEQKIQVMVKDVWIQISLQGEKIEVL
jgi:hypothetical protein